MNNKNLLSLIIVNVLVILQAIIFDWHFGTVLWIYYLQTVAIFIVALYARGKEKDDRVTLFLLCFYGFILALMTFTSGESDFEVVRDFPNTQWLGVLVASATFLINHFYSYYQDKKQKLKIRSGNKLLMRIVAIHFSFFIVVSSSTPLLAFMVIKTLIDIWSHIIQHRVR